MTNIHKITCPSIPNERFSLKQSARLAWWSYKLPCGAPVISLHKNMTVSSIQMLYLCFDTEVLMFIIVVNILHIATVTVVTTCSSCDKITPTLQTVQILHGLQWHNIRILLCHSSYQAATLTMLDNNDWPSMPFFACCSKCIVRGARWKQLLSENKHFFDTQHFPHKCSNTSILTCISTEHIHTHTHTHTHQKIASTGAFNHSRCDDGLTDLRAKHSL